MNNQETIDAFIRLKLNGMAEAFKAMTLMPVSQRPNMELTAAKLVEAETLARERHRTEMFLRTSRLRYDSYLEDIICTPERNLTKETMSQIGDCSFIRNHENILITGLTGCGKSYLACALGRQACQLGYKTEYFNMNKFIERVAISKMDGTFLKLLSHIGKNDLNIFDDFGLQPLDDNSRLALLQIIDDQYDRKSVIIISQLPLDKWYEYIAEPTMADAIMDRLMGKYTHIELQGESMRRKNKQQK